jgi:deazaflavin-dependent oxidoreductase (nitroreductase family)
VRRRAAGHRHGTISLEDLDMTDPTRPTHDPSGGRGLRRLAILGSPMTRPIAGRRLFPLYGVLHHVGRRTGREYSTPVVVRATDDAVYVPLPFGERTDWYRNARAAGGARVTWKGADHWLSTPVIVDRDAAAPGFHRAMLAMMRGAGIGHVVKFDPIRLSR